jgi:hypothetical protein
VSEKLKGCPFCGRVPAMTGWGVTESARAIECENDDCPANPMVVGDTEARAAARWNTRAADMPSAFSAPPRETIAVGDLVRVDATRLPEHGRVGHVIEVQPGAAAGESEIYLVRTLVSKRFFYGGELKKEVDA